MTADYRIVLEIADVLAVRAECVKCGASATIAPSGSAQLSPARCPGCDTIWDVPQVDRNFSPLQHVLIGLRQLLEQTKATGPVQLPYRVKLEIKDAR